MLTATLAACGGGGGGSDGGTDNPPPDGSVGGNTGSVSALYAPTAKARYHLVGLTEAKFGVLSNHEQTLDGAVVKINAISLDGDDRAVQNIAGDANFAIGRWQAGTVTQSDGTTRTLAGDDSKYHYVLLNDLTTFPASGDFTCEPGSFTTPSRTSTAGPANGSATGSASVIFDTDGANVSGSLSVIGSSNVTVSLDSTIATPTSTGFTDSYLRGGTGAAVQIADGGAGVIAVAGAYRTLINGSSYIGTYHFLCSSQ